jgi:Domain of unknown function (DUF4476)
MKVVLASLAILGVAVLASAQKEPLRKKSPQEAAAAKIAADLKEARTLLKDVQDKKTREKLELLIGRSELAAKDLVSDLAAMTPLTSMTKEDFAKLLKGIKDQSFDDGKRKYIEALPKSTRITSAQAKDLLATFSFDRDRVPAGVHLHGLVVDPELFVTVLDAFTFKSGKDELLSKIKPK